MVGHVSPRDSVPGACRLTHHVILTGRLADSIYFYCFKASLLPLFVVAVLGFFFFRFCFVCFVLSLGFLQLRLTSCLRLPKTGTIGLQHHILLLLS